MGADAARRVFDLEDRLIDFSVLVCRVIDGLPSNKIGKHVAGQLLRCGTSPAPNYGEAQSGESRKDFIHKMRVCLKELRETLVWMKFLQRRGLGEADSVKEGIQECGELIRIFVKSIATAERNDQTTS